MLSKQCTASKVYRILCLFCDQELRFSQKANEMFNTLLGAGAGGGVGGGGGEYE
jgi:hypothetical protein